MLTAAVLVNAQVVDEQRAEILHVGAERLTLHNAERVPYYLAAVVGSDKHRGLVVVEYRLELLTGILCRA